MGTQKVKIYGEEKPKQEKTKHKQPQEEKPAAEKQIVKEESKPSTEAPKKVRKSRVDEPKKRGKKWQELVSLVDKNTSYPILEAIELAKKTSYSSFDGTIEAHFRFDPKKNQTIRNTINLPYGTGKETKVVVFSEDVLASIQKGKIDFDILLAKPQDMASLARVAKILGPRGLMPNPKSGTIVENPQEAVNKFKSGMIEYKADAQNIIHQAIGKVSWETKKIEENLKVLLQEVTKYNLISASVSATMGQGVKIRVDRKQKE